MTNLPDGTTHAQLDAALGVPAYDTDMWYGRWLDEVLEILDDDDMDRATLHRKGTELWYRERRSAANFVDWMREQ